MSGAPECSTKLKPGVCVSRCSEKLNSPGLYAPGRASQDKRVLDEEPQEVGLQRTSSCCPAPMSTQHRKVTNSITLSFIYTGKTIWEPLIWVPVCPPDYFSINAFYCCKSYLGRSHCGGGGGGGGSGEGAVAGERWLPLCYQPSMTKTLFSL